jgi:hypothetical protein
MLKRIRRKLGTVDRIRNLVDNPGDLSAFRQKPTPRFAIGIGVIGFSYVISWPLIMVLGIIALTLERPMLIVVGGPLIYGISHFVFLLGAWLAGREAVHYMKLFARWSLARLCRRILIFEPPAEANRRTP